MADGFNPQVAGIVLQNNSEIVLSLMDRAVRRGLMAIGITAEGHAKVNITEFPRVDTGRLRNSITYVVSENEGMDFSYSDNDGKSYNDVRGNGAAAASVYIGTNVEYAPYVELGTGIYATDGNGRKSPWIYKDRKGKTHRTRGMEAAHFLKKAVEEHTDEYRNLLKQSMENA